VLLLAVAGGGPLAAAPLPQDSGNPASRSGALPFSPVGRLIPWNDSAHARVGLLFFRLIPPFSQVSSNSGPPPRRQRAPEEKEKRRGFAWVVAALLARRGVLPFLLRIVQGASRSCAASSRAPMLVCFLSRWLRSVWWLCGFGLFRSTAD
jgi:hypothetical protein